MCMNPKYPFILQFSERKTLEQTDLELLDHQRSFRGYMACVYFGKLFVSQNAVAINHSSVLSL